MGDGRDNRNFNAMVVVRGGGQFTCWFCVLKIGICWVIAALAININILLSDKIAVGRGWSVCQHMTVVALLLFSVPVHLSAHSHSSVRQPADSSCPLGPLFLRLLFCMPLPLQLPVAVTVRPPSVSVESFFGALTENTVLTSFIVDF